jgi:DNA helicase-2/ATP-dependent DNA helicase PcrA
MQLLPGIGPKTAGRVLDNLQLRAPPGCSAARRAAVPEGGAPAGSSSPWRCRSQRAGGHDLAGELDQAARWYEEQMDRLYDDAEVRAGRHPAARAHRRTYPSRERFLTELTLDPPDATSDEAGPPLLDEDYLILSTIHSAKGQEWTPCPLLNVVDGCIPSDLATGSEPSSRRSDACSTSP